MKVYNKTINCNCGKCDSDVPVSLYLLAENQIDTSILKAVLDALRKTAQANNISITETSIDLTRQAKTARSAYKN